MKYTKMIEDIIKNVGGTKNIKHFTHCSTRLRFTLVDESRANLNQLKSINGVIEALNKGGQTQVVIGNHVSDVFKEANKQYNFTNSDVVAINDKNKSAIISRAVDTIVGIFSPIIPAVTGAGMLKSVLAILTISQVVSTDSQTYYILNLISDAIFFFLPMLLAFSSSRKFQTDPYLSVGLAGVLMHPNWSSLVTAAEPVSFFSIPVRLFSYSSTAIPIILIIWCMSYVEKFADKASPQVVKFIMKPLLTLLITAPLALIAIGPVGSFLGNGIVDILNFIDARASFLVPTLMGAFMPLMVSVGIHMSFTPVAAMSLAQNGYDRFSGPGMLASNIAQAGATLAVAFKTKNKDLKQLATSAGITALFGITEPALYGVTLKLKRPLVYVMLSGGIAGFYAGITGLYRTAFSSPGLAALPTYVTDNPSNFINAIITMVIAFVGAFTLTLVFGFKDVEDVVERTVPITGDLTKGLYSISENATVIPLSKVNDPTFASGMLGVGVGVKLSNDEVHAPANGTVTSVFPTKHAIGIKTDDGIEILIHMGIDTVQLNGEYFEVAVSDGDRIEKGQLLAKMNTKAIQEKGYDSTVIVVITNSDILSQEKLTYEFGRVGELSEMILSF